VASHRAGVHRGRGGGPSRPRRRGPHIRERSTSAARSSAEAQRADSQVPGPGCSPEHKSLHASTAPFARPSLQTLRLQPDPNGSPHLLRDLNTIPLPNKLKSLEQVFVNPEGSNSARWLLLHSTTLYYNAIRD